MTDSEQHRPALAATGDPQVDAAIEPLASLTDTELAERPAVLEGVHDRLRDILGELGEGGHPGEPGRPGQQAELGRPAPPRPGMPRQ
jgi:hypothetical protein